MLWDGHHEGRGGEILNFYCPGHPEWPHGADLCAGKLRQEGELTPQRKAEERLAGLNSPCPDLSPKKSISWLLPNPGCSVRVWSHQPVLTRHSLGFIPVTLGQTQSPPAMARGCSVLCPQPTGAAAGSHTVSLFVPSSISP